MNRLLRQRHLKRLLFWAVLPTTISGALGGCGGGGETEPPSIAELCSLVDGDKQLKIIGGSQCPEFDSSVARLELFDEEDNPVRCSGVVISPSKVLTTAHCFNEFIIEATVFVGGESRRIVDFTPHPDFRGPGLRAPHDLGVATLDFPLSFSIRTVELGSAPQTGETIYIFGYGRTVVGEDFPRDETSLIGGTMVTGEVSALFIDALYDGSTANTCRGDSGGPAYRFDQETGELTLVGLSSSGTNETCGAGDTSIFTNLADSSNREFLAQVAPELDGL